MVDYNTSYKRAKRFTEATGILTPNREIVNLMYDLEFNYNVLEKAVHLADSPAGILKRLDNILSGKESATKPTGKVIVRQPLTRENCKDWNMTIHKVYDGANLVEYQVMPDAKTKEPVYRVCRDGGDVFSHEEDFDPLNYSEIPKTSADKIEGRIDGDQFYAVDGNVYDVIEGGDASYVLLMTDGEIVTKYQL